MGKKIDENGLEQIVSRLDEQWKRGLVREMYHKWKHLADTDSHNTSNSMLKFTPKGGKGWFALFILQKKGLKFQVSDKGETIRAPGLSFTRPTTQAQFEKDGERWAYIEREDQCGAVREAFQKAWEMKTAGR
jgi:hypothetical protein